MIGGGHLKFRAKSLILCYSNPPILSDFFLSDLGAQSSKQLSDLGAKEKGITYMVFF